MICNIDSVPDIKPKMELLLIYCFLRKPSDGFAFKISCKSIYEFEDFSTGCFTNLDQDGKMIIYESILNTFLARFEFRGRLESNKN